MKFFRIHVLVLIFLLCAPLSASAASTFEVSGWMPYWRGATSTNDVLPHLDEMTEVNPFVYSMKTDGTIVDNAGMDAGPWLSFMAAAHEKHVRVIPTIMASNGDTLQSILGHSASRIALENRIMALVNANGFDGIDIDFEGKKAETRNFFSTFLKGLYQRMGNKFVMCTIESRTPLDDRYYGSDIPADATIYSNDFVAINKYCDRVRIMAYDQQGIDQSLASQAASSSQLYAPVADPRWVRKTVEIAERDIKPSKIMIGIPTYGYEYDVTAYANNEYIYDILWTFNPRYATDLAAQYGITPTRNSAGEMAFTYTPRTDIQTTGAANLGPNSAFLAAIAASTYATQYNSHLTFRLVDWPDAQSIAGKIELAQMLGVRGVSIFKLDGGEDQTIWSVLQGVSGTAIDPVAPVQSAGALTRNLSLGMVGADVRLLQRALNSDSATVVAASGPGSPGNETTGFGPATQAAVEKFQLKYGITTAASSAFGSVGPKTMVKINEILHNI
jgi:spore germination protein YaaH